MVTYLQNQQELSHNHKHTDSIVTNLLPAIKFHVKHYTLEEHKHRNVLEACKIPNLMVSIDPAMSEPRGHQLAPTTREEYHSSPFFVHVTWYPIVIGVVLSPNSFQSWPSRGIFKRWQLIIWLAETKTVQAIGRVARRRPSRDNRLVSTLWFYINVYVPINRPLAFGDVDIVMLSVCGQVYSWWPYRLVWMKRY